MSSASRLLRRRGEADEVGEEHGDEPPLGGGRGGWATAPAGRRPSMRRTRRRTAPRQLPGGRSGRRARARRRTRRRTSRRRGSRRRRPRRSCARPPPEPARRRRHARATASPRVARRSLSPLRSASPFAASLAVLEQRDREPELQRALAEERLTAARKATSSPVSFARNRCACASSKTGRSPGRSASIRVEQLLDLGRVAEREGSLERLDEAQLHRQERDAESAGEHRLERCERLLAACPRRAGRAPPRRGTRSAPGRRPRSSGRRSRRGGSLPGRSSPRAHSVTTRGVTRVRSWSPVCAPLDLACERLVPASEEHERADRSEEEQSPPRPGHRPGGPGRGPGRRGRRPPRNWSLDS